MERSYQAKESQACYEVIPQRRVAGNLLYRHGQRRIGHRAVGVKHDRLPSANANGTGEREHTKDDQGCDGRPEADQECPSGMERFFGKVSNTLDAEEEPDGKRCCGEYSLPSIWECVERKIGRVEVRKHQPAKNEYGCDCNSSDDEFKSGSDLYT